MKILGFLFFIFSASQVLASYSQSPKKCLSKHKNQKEVCKVLAHGKAELNWNHNTIYASTGTVTEFDDGNVFFGTGQFWIFSKNGISIKTPFGTVLTHGLSEIWVEVHDKQTLVRSLSGSIFVSARGVQEYQLLLEGFEVKLGAVSLKTGLGEQSIPTSIDLEQHLISLDRVFPYDKMNFKNNAVHLSSVVLKAAQQASLIHQKIMERKIASENEKMKSLVHNAELRSRLEIYFRRIYRQKNNLDQ